MHEHLNGNKWLKVEPNLMKKIDSKTDLMNGQKPDTKNGIAEIFTQIVILYLKRNCYFY